MKRFRPLLLLLVGLGALPAPGLGQLAAPPERGSEFVHRSLAQTARERSNGRVIVKFKADGDLVRSTIMSAGAAAARSPQHAARMSQRMGLPLADGRVVMPHVQVLHGTAISSAELAARLSQDPDVEYAEVDQRVRIKAVPNDPLYPEGLSSATPTAGQWYLRPPTTNFVSAINAQSAWDITVGSPSITVAVLDTGVRLDHPDLAGKLYPGYDFIDDLPTAADGNGRDADPSDPGDWVTAGECGFGEPAEPSSWHGTQVSGLIGAATNNGVGMAGIGRNVMLLPVRVLGKCGGFQSDIVAAMRWAAGLSSDPFVNAHPARVINMSLGSPAVTGTITGCSNTYQQAVTELVNAGVAVVAPAGNDAGLAADQPSRCVGVIGVSGLRHAGTKVGYSNIGPEIAIAAPAGNCVDTGINDPCRYPLLTTTNSGSTIPATNSYSNSFNATLGTSFAAPLVAGTVALMLSANPAMSVAQVRQVLQSSARSFPTSTTDPSSTASAACRAPDGTDQIECFCTTSTCGAGMLDAAAAVARAASLLSTIASITVAPTVPVAGTAVNLDGSRSIPAPNRSIVGYAWSITSGAAIASFSGATNAATATVATSGEGSFSVRLTVTDSTGATAIADTTVKVVAPTTARVAVTPSAPVAGTVVTLDGSPSVAALGRSITGYSWAITSGSAIARFSGPTNGPTATVATSAAGNFNVRLTVTDSNGAAAATDVSVTVVPATTALIVVAPSMPIADTVINLDGSLSSAASGRNIVGYAWTITSGAAIARFSSATNGPTATVTTSGAGSFSVRLTVTDSSGAIAVADVTVMVVIVTTPPPTTALIAVVPSMPTAGTAVNLDGSLSFAASGRSIASYAWAITSGAAIARFSGPTNAPTATVATSGAGNFSVRLTVTDSGGAVAVTDVPITVVPATTALVAIAPSTPAAGTAVNLDGSLSFATSGRSIASYAWSLTSGAAIASLSGATNGPTATVATSGAGSFSVRLTVTDSSGAAAVADVTVTVTAQTTATIAVTPSAPVAGTAVNLDGSASVAALGRSITSYAWAITSGAAIASLSGPANAPTATVATSGAGNFSVQLTVTDSSGATATTDITVTVAAPDGGGSGGGAASLAWLIALALAVVSLARPSRRR